MQNQWLGMSINSTAHSALFLPSYLYCTANVLMRPVSRFCKQAVFPSIFRQEENAHTLEIFSNTKAELSITWFTRSLEKESQTKAQAAEVPKCLLLPSYRKTSLPINEVLLRTPLVHYHCSPLSPDKAVKGLDQGSREV